MKTWFINGVALSLLFAVPTVAVAQGAPLVKPRISAQESQKEAAETEYKAAKERADARERDWDRKMRERMKSICSGC